MLVFSMQLLDMMLVVHLLLEVAFLHHADKLMLIFKLHGGH